MLQPVTKSSLVYFALGMIALCLPVLSLAEECSSEGNVFSPWEKVGETILEISDQTLKVEALVSDQLLRVTLGSNFFEELEVASDVTLKLDSIELISEGHTYDYECFSLPSQKAFVFHRPFPFPTVLMGEIRIGADEFILPLEIQTRSPKTSYRSTSSTSKVGWWRRIGQTNLVVDDMPIEITLTLSSVGIAVDVDFKTPSSKKSIPIDLKIEELELRANAKSERDTFSRAMGGRLSY